MQHQNHLYVWDDRFLYITAGMASDLTQRHTVTLLIALGFALGDANGRRQRYQAALVARQTSRSLETPDSGLLSLNYDPQSYEFHALSHFLGKQPVKPVILQPGSLQKDELRRIGQGTCSRDLLFRLTTRMRCILPRRSSANCR